MKEHRMEPRNKREEKLLTRFQQEPPARFATRDGRRRLVAAGAGILALLWVNTAVSWVLAPSDTAMFTCFAILGIVLLAGGWVWHALTLSTRGTIGLPEHLLDERQAKERLRAHAVAHRLTILLLFVTYFIVLQALPEGRDENTTGVASAAVALLFLALLATVWAMPLLAAAWRLPDPPPPEDDEDEDEDVRV
jgi:MFS family permease